mgnify:FL=1
MPIAALAELRDGRQLYLRALIAKPDGTVIHRTERQGAANDSDAMARDASLELRAAGGSNFFDD